MDQIMKPTTVHLSKDAIAALKKLKKDPEFTLSRFVRKMLIETAAKLK